MRVLGPGDDPEDRRAGVTVAAPMVVYGGRAVPRFTVVAPGAPARGRS